MSPSHPWTPQMAGNTDAAESGAGVHGAVRFGFM